MIPTVKIMMLPLLLLFLSCGAMLSYTVYYADGVKERDAYISILKGKKFSYEVIKHGDDMYEIRYQEH